MGPADHAKSRHMERMPGLESVVTDPATIGTVAPAEQVRW